MAVVHVADVRVLVGQRVMAVPMAVPEGLVRLEVREILRSVGMNVVRITIYRGHGSGGAGDRVRHGGASGRGWIAATSLC